MTNVTDLRRQWPRAGFPDIALVARRLQVNRQTYRQKMSVPHKGSQHESEILFRLEVNTAAAAQVRRSCQLRV